jgi:hypothetical protein
LWSDLWQGLAQIYVAITHAARGNRKGAERLMQKAGERPTAYAATGDTTYGLDLDAVTACTRGHTRVPIKPRALHPFWPSRSADVTIAACEQKSQTGSEMPQRGSRRLWSW